MAVNDVLAAHPLVSPSHPSQANPNPQLEMAGNLFRIKIKFVHQNDLMRRQLVNILMCLCCLCMINKTIAMLKGINDRKETLITLEWRA